MKPLFVLCLLPVVYGTAVSELTEYFFVSHQMNWTWANYYCGWKHGHLARVATEAEYAKAAAVAKSSVLAWIGLYRSDTYVDRWYWSNGEKTDFTKWKLGEPDNRMSGGVCAAMEVGGWHDVNCVETKSVMCSRRFVLVKETKTWEEALRHCRTRYADLAFVDSELSLGFLKAFLVTELQTVGVWTGLRFSDGRWLWVNGAPMESLVPLPPQCPVYPYRCGYYNFDVWENRDCNETFNFVCYY